MEYRYHLLKYRGKSSRFTCPSCGKPHCFSPHVNDDENIVGEEYGRCDHESSCGYVKYPPSEYDPLKRRNSNGEDWRQAPEWLKRSQSRPKPKVAPKPQPKQLPSGELCTIPMDIALRSVKISPVSHFLSFLLTILTPEQVIYLVQEYRIGVTKNLDVIFYQFDIEGRCRTGKVMSYNPENGHRKKDTDAATPITWVHSLLKRQGVLPQEWELTQCLFGEHLLKLYPEKVVALVESEKTAVICAALRPECIWLATGGKGQLNDRVEVLQGSKILAFPDVDGYDVWVDKAAERPHLHITVSDYLEKTATPQEREAHIDIADRLIALMQSESGNSSPARADPPPTELVSTNPVFLEVQKYFSPEFHSEVLALIKDLDLEFVRVTRVITEDKNF